MIFDELSFAFFRVALRRLGAELVVGGGLNPTLTCIAQNIMRSSISSKNMPFIQPHFAKKATVRPNYFLKFFPFSALLGTVGGTAKRVPFATG